MRRRILAGCVVLLAPLMAATSRSAEALPQVGLASVAVQCTATFPLIPAPPWTPGGSCNGTATLEGVGIDATLATPNQHYLINGTGAFAASFQYYEPCLANGQPGVFVSFADGTFTISSLSAERPVGITTTASVSGTFSWKRIGTSPVIVIGSASLKFANQPVGAPPLPIGPGSGTASFVPPTTYNPAVHVCGVGGPATTGVVAGAAISL